MNENAGTLIQQLEPLFNPRAVAVIGATNNITKWGFSTWNSLLNGYQGRVYPINRREDKIQGRKAYKRITDIPENEPVDMAIFVIPAENIPATMQDCVDKGVRAAVIITAGFAETGEEGLRLQNEVLRIARSGNLRFIGGNCMGFWSARANMRAFMFPLMVMDGPLALVSQGGNIGGNVVSFGHAKGVGFRSYVSCGCTADIPLEDYIEYFGDDPKVEVITAYIEGVKDGTRFIEKVRKVTAKKPVIVLKPGRTQAATLAITSHSGSLAGASSLYDSAFKKAGVLRVNTPEELLDTAVGFITQPLPKGNKIAIISPGGSYGVLTADACAQKGLDVIKLSDETLAEFDKIFPPRWSRGNPVDPAGDRDFISYMQAPDLLLKLPDVDSLLYMGFSNFTNMATRFSGVNQEMAKAYRKLIEELISLIPDEGNLEGPDASVEWMEKVTTRIVSIFFAMFGASGPEGLKAFAQKLIGVLKSEKTGPRMKEYFLETARNYYDGVYGPDENPFTKVHQALMEGLLINWIEKYDKPLITTSFMDSFSESSLGYHSFSTPERAALVLSQMIEYSKYLERVEQKQH